jgi:hypothetical protein
MKKHFATLALIAIPIILLAQTPNIGEVLSKVDTIATLLAGFATTVLTQVFTNYTGSSKTNALISAICIALAVAGALWLVGIPTLGVTSIFTIASGLFAIYRKLYKAS